MWSRITVLFLAILAGLPPLIPPIRAEGTAQLMPAGSASDCIAYIQGNDGSGKEGPGFNSPWSDRIYVHIEDPSTETIYYGFTKMIPSSQEVYYRIIDPNGAILRAGKVASSSADSGYVADDGVEVYQGPRAIAGGMGYRELECSPTVAGDYAIVFNVGSPTTVNSSPKYYVHPFDVTVADVSGPGKPDPIPGRLFSYNWNLNTNSSGNKACMDFYTWTPDSLVMRMDMNEIRPFGFTVSFNSHGADSTGNIVADRRSSGSVSAAVPGYPVFLNEPDPTAYPTGTPGSITYLDVAGCHADGNFCIEVNATKVGEINVYIDFNGNGTYDEGTVDRYFPFHNETAGTICVPWDGLDGLGHPIGAGTSGTVVVQFLAGVVHFPVYDAENHPNGFTCEMIRPSGYTPRMYFDNRGTRLGTFDLNGCLSNCNRWSGNDGNNLMINTWINTITSSDTAIFTVDDLCPPLATGDTACSSEGMELQYSILSNDSDSDNSLDPSSVTLSNISPAGAHVVYDNVQHILRYTPAAGEDTLRLDYQVCDNTSAALGGPLCDQASVLIAVYGHCSYTMTLDAATWQLQSRLQASNVELSWQLNSEQVVSSYLIERAGPGEPFVLIDTVSRHKLGRYVDRGVTAYAWSQARYRIKAHLQDGSITYSPTHQINLPRHGELWAELIPQPQHLQLRYLAPEGGLVQIIDLHGRTVYQAELQPLLPRQEMLIDTETWNDGLYLIQVGQEDWVSLRQKFRIQRQ